MATAGTGVSTNLCEDSSNTSSIIMYPSSGSVPHSTGNTGGGKISDRGIFTITSIESPVATSMGSNAGGNIAGLGTGLAATSPTAQVINQSPALAQASLLLHRQLKSSTIGYSQTKQYSLPCLFSSASNSLRIPIQQPHLNSSTPLRDPFQLGVTTMTDLSSNRKT
jgi:hypothetical protein